MGTGKPQKLEICSRSSFNSAEIAVRRRAMSKIKSNFRDLSHLSARQFFHSKLCLIVWKWLPCLPLIQQNATNRHRNRTKHFDFD